MKNKTKRGLFIFAFFYKHRPNFSTFIIKYSLYALSVEIVLELDEFALFLGIVIENIATFELFSITVISFAYCY